MSRASGARRSRAERDPGPSAENREARLFRLPSVVSPLGPGSRCARPGHERGARTTACEAAAREANRWPSSRIHDVKQRSLLRSRGALLRPGFVLVLASIPDGGVGGAPTGALFLLSRLRDATDPRSVRRGASHDAGRSPLGAPPWRFSAGGRASISGIASGSVQRAPRSQVVMPGGRCPGPPAHRSEASGDNR